MKIEKARKIITNFVAPRAIIYVYKLQKDDHEIKNSEIKKAKVVKNLHLKS